MKPLKVLYVIDTLEYYGAERSLVELAKEYRSISPVFINIYPGSGLKNELSERDIKVYSLNIKAKYGFREIIQKLEKIYRLETPDIIHSTLFRADLAARMMKSKFSNIPLVNSWVTNSYSDSRYRNKGFITSLKLWRAFLKDKNSVKKVDWFLANSFTIEESNRLALKVPNDKTRVIYRGRKAAKFKAMAKGKRQALKQQLNLENRKILLNVGRLIPSKGQLELIQVMPSLIDKFPDVNLLIVGEGHYRKVLQQEIKKFGLENYVQLLGSRQDVPELLAVSDFFVFPSYLEGLSGALIEAMMAGKVIISSDIKENLECVDENCALIFKTGNKNSLLENLEYALNNYLNINLGEIASKVAQNKFDIKLIARQYEDFYKSLKN